MPTADPKWDVSYVPPIEDEVAHRAALRVVSQVEDRADALEVLRALGLADRLRQARS